MLNHLSDTDLRLGFDIRLDNEFVVPDAGSLRLTIRGPNGEAISGYDSKLLPDVLINHVLVWIPAASNVLPSGEDFQIRYVELDFLSAGSPGKVKTNYRVVPFMPVQIGPQEVRQALGISYGELDDDSVDIFQSFLRLKSSENFLTALQSGTVSSVYANQVLLYTEALRIAPSLRSRILKQEEKDNALYSRFVMNFEALRAELEAALLEAENLLAEELGQTVTTDTTIFLVTLPTDPVTGS